MNRNGIEDTTHHRGHRIFLALGGQEARRDQGGLIEALEVAVEMGGGPALMYAAKALDAFRAELRRRICGWIAQGVDDGRSMRHSTTAGVALWRDRIGRLAEDTLLRV